jgi:hypothetical protein
MLIGFYEFVSCMIIPLELVYADMSSIYDI